MEWNRVKIAHPLFEMFGTRSLLDFQFLNYLHIHNEISWGRYPCLSTKFVYVLYIPSEGYFFLDFSYASGD